ncbi:alpha/beta hydrolase [Alkalimarinus sediminis]|uniref:Alpha/beta hydrolase n=1 Tax=Alkalimarinus sediminis TaxID=1632866 RepID=A0A9E8HHC9_9ALTE|nr:alpha/beta hydrolase [Alkalimarinus sediminis]UZW74305.1 alpha/beta hydrolase [Alkalimarinus sediminis]
MIKTIQVFISIALLALLSACASKPIEQHKESITASKSECVVLLHGLWRSGFAMRSIASDLEDYGFHTVSIDYPSTEMEIPLLAENFVPDGIKQCQQTGADRIHLVTHSMGGILARQYLQNHRLPEGSRVVMLSPPNQGSDISKKFNGKRWYQWLVGPAGASLTQSNNGIISQLSEVDEPIGVIAAYRNWSLWPESWLPTPNDGTVSVKNMMLKEMDDVILVKSGHATMRYKDEIHHQIRHFIQTGAFDHNTLEGVANAGLMTQ